MCGFDRFRRGANQYDRDSPSPSLQAILVGRGAQVHASAGWNKVSNTVSEIFNAAPILGGGGDSKGIGNLMPPGASNDSEGGTLNAKGGDGSSEVLHSSQTPTRYSPYQSIQPFLSPGKSAKSSDNWSSAALNVSGPMSTSTAKNWMMGSLKGPEESPPEKSMDSGMDTRSKMKLLKPVGGPVRVSSYRSLPGKETPVVET